MLPPKNDLGGGVFLGSAAWWLLFDSRVSLLRRKVSTNLVVQVNRVSGLVIAGSGAVGFFLD